MHRVALLLSIVAVSGCALPPSAAQKLSQSAQDYVESARFGRTDIAGDYVREIAREDFTKKHASWGKAVRIEDMEISGLQLRKDGDADVYLSVTWQRMSETTMRVTELTQRWTSTRGTWTIISEEQKSGDKGLIGEVEAPKIDEAAPPSPARSRYQTRVIYEQ